MELWPWYQEDLSLNLALDNCVTLVKSLNFSLTQFPHQ